MRQVINTTVIRRYTYPLLLSLIVILLVLFGSSQNEQVKIKAEETQKSGAATGLYQVANSVNDVSVSNGSSDAQEQSSTSTKVKIKINSSTQNGNTCESSEITVTQYGQTTTLSEPIDEAGNDCNFDININNGEFDFDCDFDQDSENETEINQRIKIKQESN